MQRSKMLGRIAWSSGWSVRLVVGRLDQGFNNSLAESYQKTLKVGIHSFLA